MPEAPEVESMARHLRPYLNKARIQGVRVTDARVLRGVSPYQLKQRLTGRMIHSIERRGKAVCLILDTGALVILPRMTGRFELFSSTKRIATHPHEKWRLILSNHMTLVYNDTRCLSDVWVVKNMTDCGYVLRLGPDMLDCPTVPREVMKAAGRSRQPIKAWLMDAKHVAGVGNIYANEILFAARIHPMSAAHRLTEVDWHRLWAKGHEVLQRAVLAGGTTIRDHKTPDGRMGGYQHHLAVYGRHGEPCRVCGATIQKTILSGRSTYYCPSCQMDPEGIRAFRILNKRMSYHQRVSLATVHTL